MAMRLPELPLILIEEKLKMWRRRAIVGAIAVVCGVIALSEGLSAARIALEPAFGAAGSRLAIALFFAAVILVAFASLWNTERPATGEAEGRRDPGESKFLVIAEAIHLGYGLAQDLRRARASAGEGDAQAQSEADDKARARRER